MVVAVNDLSFKKSFYNRTDALDAVRRFIRLCHLIESIKCHNVNRIAGTEIDKESVMYPGKTIYGVVQEIPVREERTYFLSLLVNRGEHFPLPKYPFVFHDMQSYICSGARNDAVVSIETDSVFTERLLTGLIGGESVSIRNLSNDCHIKIYGKDLGIRIYKANDKKHKKDRFNAFGKNTASPMRLNDEEAQELLDRAIEVNGRLYARKDGINYAFQQERECVYHGYEDYSIPVNIQVELDKERWD